ncbi:MAG: hypothetical protein J7L91_02660 [Candidatus Korarchaeota archaeon]|nr:hypothetical protein [Candidatus Korarchaeota archaeon]
MELGKAYHLLLENARRRDMRRKPALNDAIVLATALTTGGFIVAGDKHFKGLDGVIWVGD